VNLFISNFRYKNRCLLFIFTGLVAYILLNVVIGFLYSRVTSKNYFIDEKFSKSAHMLFNTAEAKDIVFLGNSRTLYQVSTNFFKEAGIRIYNFGASGRQISDYPWMMYKVIKTNAKVVVLSVDVEDFYEEPKETRSPTGFDLMCYMLSNQSKLFIIHEMYNYIKSKNIIWSFSPVIFTHICGIIDTINKNRFFGTGGDRKTKFSSDNKALVALDCTPFAIEQLKYSKTLVKCTNGDGVLLGNSNKKDYNMMILLKKNVNKNTLKLVDQIQSIAYKNNKKLIVLLMPTYNTRYKFDVQFLKTKINSEILDLSNMRILDFMWTDDGHLNNFGREYYSRTLVKMLSHVVIH